MIDLALIVFAPTSSAASLKELAFVALAAEASSTWALSCRP